MYQGLRRRSPRAKQNWGLKKEAIYYKHGFGHREANVGLKTLSTALVEITILL